MSTVKLRRLRPELAVQFTLRPGERCPWFPGERSSSWPLLLNQLELGAALLERDARNGRAILTERGIPLPRSRRRIFSLRAGRATSQAILQAATRSRIRSIAWIMRLVRSPRLSAALRITGYCIIDGVKAISIACVILLLWVLPLLLVAPPD